MTKIGRPKKDESEARNKRLHVLLTEAEQLDLIERSGKAGFSSLSDFVRAAIVSDAPQPRGRGDRKDIFSIDDRRALVNLGNNLNQVARVRNSGRPNVMADELAETIDKLNALFDRYLP